MARAERRAAKDKRMSSGLPRLLVTTLGIGHGDATLLRWDDEEANWTALIDGGQYPRTLHARLQAAGVARIDLLVVSHYDSDHLSGLLGITKVCEVGSCWAPALAAFERHRWLFGDESARALDRARELEAELAAAGIPVMYPLEGYSSQPVGDAGPQFHVLSPPARLVRSLLTLPDVSWLFASHPTPLGWLLEFEDPSGEQPADLVALDAALATGVLAPDDIPERLRTPVQPTPGVDPQNLAQAWSAASGAETEFFGDSTLNNSSLVLWIEAATGAQRHRVLLAGDQENWCYLFGRHPRGLQADVLKASHHGGRIYLENRETPHEFFGFLRPKAVLFSANGKHGLPRADTRQKAVSWGAAVFCTSQRGRELVLGTPANEICCHAGLECTRETRDVTLTLDASGIYSATPACHSGHGREPGPVIEVIRHVIAPSPMLDRLFEAELRDHIRWVKDVLDAEHTTRVAQQTPDDSGSPPLNERQLALLARRAKRDVIIPHLPAVLERGMNRGAFWAARDPNQWAPELGRSLWTAYHRPADTEKSAYISMLESKTTILFVAPDRESDRRAQPPRREITGTDALLAGLDVSGLASHAESRMCIPAPAYRDLLWPSTVAVLARSWHGFRHSSGTLVISRDASVPALVDRLLNTYYPDSLNQFRSLDRHANPLDLPELVGSAIQEKTPSIWKVEEAVNSLFNIDCAGLDSDARQTLAEFPESIQRGISLVSLWSSGKDQLVWNKIVDLAHAADVRVSQLLACGFRQLW